MPIHADAASVEQQRAAQALSRRSVYSAANGGRHRDQDDLAALAADSEYSMPVLLAEVVDVRSDGLKDPINASRKSDVADSLDKTKTHLSGLTDWVLCTRRPFAPIDGPWWEALTGSAPFELDHQVADDLANLLIGAAELFRQTYFGDLVLTPDRLEALQERVLADVQERWFPEVHQTSPAETKVRRMLAEPDAWEDLEALGTEISSLTTVIESNVDTKPLEASIQEALDELLVTAETIRQLLAEAHEHLTPGGNHTWRELGEAAVPDPPPTIPPVLRKLRAANHPAALACGNLAHHNRGCSWGLNPPVLSRDLAM